MSVSVRVCSTETDNENENEIGFSVYFNTANDVVRAEGRN